MIGLAIGVVPGVRCGLGIGGCGQVISWYLSSQKGRILSNKYHCLSDDSPDGEIVGGKSVAAGCQASFSSETVVMEVSLNSLHSIVPGDDERI